MGIQYTHSTMFEHGFVSYILLQARVKNVQKPWMEERELVLCSLKPPTRRLNSLSRLPRKSFGNAVRVTCWPAPQIQLSLLPEQKRGC